ncbi:MAG: glycosyl transferase group 1 [Acidobacteria bacterium]|nr:glycosyl transferase group 1 [Acidobacteriota bacterium]
MHIVVVDTTLTTPPTGGAQTFLVNLAESLVKKDIRLSVVTQPGSETTIVSALRAAGAEVCLNVWTAAHLPEEKAPLLAEWVNQSGSDIYVISISPDVGWLALPLLDPALATLSIAHNDVSAFYEPLKHYHPFMDCAVGVSEAIRRKIVDDCGVPFERTTSIAYGIRSLTAARVDEMLAQPSAGGPLRIGYVGRMVQEQKRVMEFVPLVAELVKRQVNFELHLIGDGSARLALEAELNRRGLHDRVKFWGWLGSHEVAQRLQALDVFVLLSDYEGLPVALLEAMGHALVPVVTIIESGNQELVQDGLNGFAIAVGDINSFADRLTQLAHDPEQLARMKYAAWQTGETYSVERMTTRYLGCFAETKARIARRDYRPDPAVSFPVMPSCRSKYPLWLRRIKWRARAVVRR